MFMQFSLAETKRMFSTELVERLNAYSGRPWKDLLRGKPIGGSPVWNPAGKGVSPIIFAWSPHHPF